MESENYCTCCGRSWPGYTAQTQHNEKQKALIKVYENVKKKFPLAYGTHKFLLEMIDDEEE